MNPELLQTFLKIVKYKQISQAADSLYITQAAVSNRLSRLESQLGVKLINRVKGQANVTLTKYGRRLVPIANEWMELVQETANLKELANYDNLTMISSVDINTSLLSLLLPDFMEDNPLLRYTINTGNTEKIYTSIENGTADLGISFNKISRYQVDSRKIGEERLFLITGADSDYPDFVTTTMLSRSDELFVPWNEDYVNWHLMCWDDSIKPLLQADGAVQVPGYLRFPKAWTIIPESCVQIMAHLEQPYRVLQLLEEPPALKLYALKKKDRHLKQASIDRLILQLRSAIYKYHQQQQNHEA